MATVCEALEKIQASLGQMEGRSGPSWGRHLGTPAMTAGIELAPLVAHLGWEVCGEGLLARPGGLGTLHLASTISKDSENDCGPKD